MEFPKYRVKKEVTEFACILDANTMIIARNGYKDVHALGLFTNSDRIKLVSLNENCTQAEFEEALLNVASKVDKLADLLIEAHK